MHSMQYYLSVRLLAIAQDVRTGDRYDGEFSVGQEDGLGIFTWADGTTYEGTHPRDVHAQKAGPNSCMSLHCKLDCWQMVSIMA